MLNVLIAEADAVVEENLELHRPVHGFDFRYLGVGAVLHQAEIARLDRLGREAGAVENAGKHLDLLRVLRRGEGAEQTDTGNRGEQLQTHAGPPPPCRQAADGC